MTACRRNRTSCQLVAKERERSQVGAYKLRLSIPLHRADRGPSRFCLLQRLEIQTLLASWEVMTNGAGVDDSRVRFARRRFELRQQKIGEEEVREAVGRKVKFDPLN